MTDPVVMARLIRGDLEEGCHRGHAVICDAGGSIVEAWGDPGHLIYPRSSCKMLQALPLVESGAAEAAGLGSEHLALACASHQGADIHHSRVRKWLHGLGLDEPDLRCGSQPPGDPKDRAALREAGEAPDQCHNNCSGKHAGFLTLNSRLDGGSEYIDVDHPVQIAVRQAFEEMTGETSPGFGIDGCSAPNFACSLKGLALAMARMAAPQDLGRARAEASRALVRAMGTHPLLIAGEGRACTELVTAMRGKVVIKTGAEAVFAAILPEQGLGLALKIEDGATRASEAAMAALLVRLGCLERNHPMIEKRANAPLFNRRNIPAARLIADEALF